MRVKPPLSCKQMFFSTSASSRVKGRSHVCFLLLVFFPSSSLEQKQRKQFWCIWKQNPVSGSLRVKNLSVTDHTGSWREWPLGATVSSVPGRMSEPVIPWQQGPGWGVVVRVGLWAPESYLTRPHSDSHLRTLAYHSLSPVHLVKYSWRCSYCHLRMSKLEETPGRNNRLSLSLWSSTWWRIPHAFLVNGCAALLAFRRNLQIVH